MIFKPLYFRHIIIITILSLLIWTYSFGLDLRREDYHLRFLDSTGATVADLNSDGILDVIIAGGGIGSNRRIITALDGSNLQGPRIFEWELLENIDTIPAVADLNGDGRLELVFANDADYVIAFDAGQSDSWQERYKSESKIVSSPVISDLDGDGILEVIVSSNNGEILVISSNDGKFSQKYTGLGKLLSAPAVEDLDADGDNDLAVGNKDGVLYALDGMPESENPEDAITWKISTGGAISSSPVIGDIDNDGKLEVVAASCDGYVYVVDGINGREKYIWRMGNGSRKEKLSPVTMADLDSDGYLDVLVGDSHGGIYAFSGSGREMWNIKLPGQVISSLLVADVDGNHSMEVMALSTKKAGTSAYLLDGKDGQELIKRELRGEINSHSVIADLEKDGRMEIVIGPYILSSSDSGEVRWGKFAGEPANTGSADRARRFAADPVEYFKNPDANAYVPVLPARKPIWQGEDLLSTAVNFADMDNDGVLDIITVTKTSGFWQTISKIWGFLESSSRKEEKYLYNRIRIIDGKTHEARDFKDKAIGNISGTPGVGRIVNSDNWLDVVVTCENGRTCSFDGATGRLAWRTPYQMTEIETAPVLTDANGDGLMDVAVGSSDKHLYILNGKDGSIIWKYKAQDKISKTPAVSDLDSDGNPELVVADDGGLLHAIDIKNKELKWSTPTAGRPASSPIIADIDGDGSKDIIIRAGDNSIYAINGADGRQLWKRTVPFLLGPSISVANIDDEGDMEIFASVANRKVIYTIKGKDGSKLWQNPVDAIIEIAPMIAEMEGDDIPEAILGSRHYIYVMDSQTGKQLHRYYIEEDRFRCSAILDIDGDGFLDIVASSPDSKSLYILPTSSEGNSLWAKEFGDPYNANDVSAAISYAADPTEYFGNKSDEVAIHVKEEPIKSSDTEPPEIVIEYPVDGSETASERIVIRGYVTDDQQVATVSVEVIPVGKAIGVGPAAIPELQGTKVNLARAVDLEADENIIHIQAVDSSGNKSDKLITVFRITSEKRSDKATVEKWALLVGVNEYRDKDIRILKYAVADVMAMRDLLIDPLVGGYKWKNVKTITDEEATRGNILGALHNWLSMADEDDMVLIYFSGHGWEHEGKSYLLPYETRLDYIPAYAIDNSDFARAVDWVKANKVVTFMDCCHGGISQSGKDAGETLSSSFYEPFRNMKGRLTLASCSDGELSYEWDDKGHGVFTYFLLEGMRGDADKDDGIITFSELSRYVRENVIEWAINDGKKQTPEYDAQGVNADIPLSVNMVKILTKMVLDLHKEKKISASAKQYAILELLGSADLKNGKLSSFKLEGLELLIDILNKRTEPEMFEIWLEKS